MYARLLQISGVGTPLNGRLCDSLNKKGREWRQVGVSLEVGNFVEW